jgi:hypothetical protein
MKKKQAPYQKPKIKSSKIKTISFFNHHTLRSAADVELLLAYTIL